VVALGVSAWLPVGAAALTLGPTRTLPGSETSRRYSPQAAVSSNGRTLVTWLSGEHGTLVADLGRDGGAWMRPQRLFGGDGVARVEAVGRNGTAAIAWITGDGETSASRKTVMLATALPGRAFGAAKVVTSGHWLSAPSGVVVRPNGQVVLDWLRSLSGTDGNPSELEYAVANAAGAIHTSVLGASGRYDASIAESERGAVLLAYRTPLGLPSFPLNQQAAAAVMPTGASSFGPPAELTYDKVDPYGEVGNVEALAGPGRTVLRDDFSTHGESGTELLAVEGSGVLGAPRKLASGPSYSKLQARDELSESPDALAADGVLVEAWQETRFKGEYGGPVAAEAVMASITPESAMAVAAPQQIYGSAHPTAPTAPMVVAFGDSTVVMWSEDAPAFSCGVRWYYADRYSAGRFSGRLPVSSAYDQGRDECGTADAMLVANGEHALAVWGQNGAIEERSFNE
jgi:hypothetical protein